MHLSSTKACLGSDPLNYSNLLVFIVTSLAQRGRKSVTQRTGTYIYGWHYLILYFLCRVSITGRYGQYYKLCLYSIIQRKIIPSFCISSNWSSTFFFSKQVKIYNTFRLRDHYSLSLHNIWLVKSLQTYH